MSRRALGERVQVSDSAVAAWESEMATHDHIVIRLIKMSSTVGTQYTGSFSLASYSESEVGYMDDAISGNVVDNSDEMSRLRRMFEKA
jgi:hypothetical protein